MGASAVARSGFFDSDPKKLRNPEPPGVLDQGPDFRNHDS